MSWSPSLRMLTLLTFICFSIGISESLETKNNVILGGIFPISQKEIIEGSEITTVTDRGIQRLEAMLFAIDKLNREEFIPGIRFTPQIIDSFDNYSTALRESMKFVSASQVQDKASKFLGVVGASRSSVTHSVAKLLQLFHIPMISYASTHAALSDLTRYELLLRTVSNDHTFAVIMSDIAKHHNWSYVSVIGSESTNDIARRFVREMKNKGCVAIYDLLPLNPEKDNCKKIVQRLISKSNAKAVFSFLNSKDLTCLLNAASDLEVHQNFVWITNNYVDTDVISMPVRDNIDIITVDRSISKNIKAFQEYFSDLKFSEANPWLQEYLKIKPSAYLQERRVPNVINSVYAFAHGFRNAWTDLCSAKPGMCQQLLELRGDEFFHKYLKEVNFTDISGNNFHFNGNEVIEEFSVYQIKMEENLIQPAGKWDEKGLDISGFKWNNATPVSVCSLPCEKGYRKLEYDSCCWICLKIADDEYRIEGDKYAICPDGYKANQDRTGCELNKDITTKSEAGIGVIKGSVDVDDSSCSKAMKKLNCRISHLEHNLLPLKYEAPNCRYDRN